MTSGGFSPTGPQRWLSFAVALTVEVRKLAQNGTVPFVYYRDELWLWKEVYGKAVVDQIIQTIREEYGVDI